MIWLTGCKGQLGSAFAHLLSKRKIDFIGTGSELDLGNELSVKEFVSKYKFDYI